jgi:hypothetical protein
MKRSIATHRCRSFAEAHELLKVLKTSAISPCTDESTVPYVAEINNGAVDDAIHYRMPFEVMCKISDGRQFLETTGQNITFDKDQYLSSLKLVIAADKRDTLVKMDLSIRFCACIGDYVRTIPLKYLLDYGTLVHGSVGEEEIADTFAVDIADQIVGREPLALSFDYNMGRNLFGGKFSIIANSQKCAEILLASRIAVHAVVKRGIIIARHLEHNGEHTLLFQLNVNEDVFEKCILNRNSNFSVIAPPLYRSGTLVKIDLLIPQSAPKLASTVLQIHLPAKDGVCTEGVLEVPIKINEYTQYENKIADERRLTSIDLTKLVPCTPNYDLALVLKFCENTILADSTIIDVMYTYRNTLVSDGAAWGLRYCA